MGSAEWGGTWRGRECQEEETENKWQQMYKGITKHCSEYGSERVEGIFQWNGIRAIFK